MPDNAKLLKDRLLDELPSAAVAVSIEFERALDKIRAAHDGAVARIEAEAAARIEAAQSETDQAVASAVEFAKTQLHELQMKLIGEGNVSEALAVAAQTVLLELTGENPPSTEPAQPDPGSLANHAVVGATYRFQVTGRADGTVWGSGPYTSDSNLATAAVHAGAVGIGESAVVSVEVVSMAGQAVVGTAANGVKTHDWGSYDVGYLVAD